MRTNPLQSLLIASVAGLTLASSPALANIVFMDGNNPQDNETNIHFESSTTGPKITGDVSIAPGVFDFVFTSPTGQTLTNSGPGQANISNAGGGNLTGITMSSPGNMFGDMIVNFSNPRPSAVDISVLSSDGRTFNFVKPTGGSGFATLVAQGNERIISATFTSATSAGFPEFGQPRISGSPFPVEPIPEPSTWAMIVLGLGLIGFAGWRSRKRKTPFSIALS